MTPFRMQDLDQSALSATLARLIADSANDTDDYEIHQAYEDGIMPAEVMEE